ncbi:E3 ubiquitin ligase BIG BROTHER [Phytophthora nicotianae]|uniref:E3 ubiquitin ligase BIG BROTHER n=1 Tax=Phytophthora nicotianae TaxID=4792 RepID=A0A0W8CT97_PHYNI|nr:E3 ubiquitin ligase BIG BROTHER [Phytophthora nicotianae]
MKLVWALGVALLAFVSTLSPVQAQCGARVRKDWDSMTTAEKDTYKGALAAAMDSGAYIKFVEMHTEMQSEMEAHRQCMFIYWHRLLLVVFENMLRGQGSQYACVTVPYYNWVGASNRMLAGTCSSLGDCSTITRELGGYTTGSQRTININGINNSGRSPTVAPTTTPPTSTHYDGNNNNQDVVTVNKETAEEKKVSDWYKKTMANMGGQCPEAMADLERQVCMFENQCLGGTKDYSAEFKATWGAKEPRCLTIVNSIKSGQQKITYGNWRKDMESYFGCPKPANATQSTKQNTYSDTTQSIIQDATQSVAQTATNTLSSVVQSV